VETFRGGLYSGVDGAVIDMTLFAEPWGVDLSAIKIPARLWLGDADGNVPLGPARSLARAISSCELISLPAQGHYWITGNAAEVVEWIAGTLRSPATQTH
jgi:pimeloyl-ACP methyl ester carboxylesterase